MEHPETESADTENKRAQRWKALPNGSFIWQRNSKAEARVVPAEVLDELRRLRKLEIIVNLMFGLPVLLLLLLAISHNVNFVWAVGGLIIYILVGSGIYHYSKSRSERLEQRYAKAENIFQQPDFANAFLTGMPDRILGNALFVSVAGAIGSTMELGIPFFTGQPFLLDNQSHPWPILLLILVGGTFAAYHLNRERIRRKYAEHA